MVGFLGPLLASIGGSAAGGGGGFLGGLGSILGGIGGGGGQKGSGGGSGGGLSGLGEIIGGIGGFYNASKQRKLAKRAFLFQKDFAEANLNNQVQSYNTQLADRIRSRTHTEGGTQASANQYVANNSLQKVDF